MQIYWLLKQVGHIVRVGQTYIANPAPAGGASSIILNPKSCIFPYRMSPACIIFHVAYILNWIWFLHMRSTGLDIII
jgi:hypothetical protein